MNGPATTKVSPLDDFKRVINHATSEAMDAHVGSRAIVAHLRSQATWLENRSYVSPSSAAATTPKSCDQWGRPIDLAGEVEAARAAR